MLKKKTNILKKSISAVLSAAVMFSIANTGFAATYIPKSYKQPVVIDEFNTFDALAEGAAADEIFSGATIRQNGRNVSVQADENGGKNIRLNGGAWVDYVFDEAIKSGVLHFGFDYKSLSTSTGMYVRGFDNTRQPDNMKFTYNTWTPYDGGKDNENWVGMLNIGSSNSDKKVTFPNRFGSGSAPSAGDAGNAVTDLDTDWHRYDMYIAFGVKGVWKTYYFMDGVLKKTGDSNGGLKSIGFSGNAEALLDNLTLEHYPTVPDGLDGGNENGYFKATQIKMDANYTPDTTGNSAGEIKLSFSEPIALLSGDATEFEKADITIKNAAGEITEGAVKEGQYGFNSVIVTMDKEKVKPGIYTVEISDDVLVYYSGKISGTAPNSAKFIVLSDSINVADKKSYMDESFDDYGGGMPNGFVRTADLSYDGDYNIESSTDSERGNGIKLNGEDVVYRFPQAIKDGNFTIEFDVKPDSGSKWFVGLPLAHIFESDEWTQAKGWTGANDGGSIVWEDGILRNVGYFIGQSTSDTSVQYAESKSSGPKTVTATDSETQTQVPVALEGLSVNEDAWNNFKIDVDLNDGKAYVTLNNDTENKATITFSTARFQAELLGRKSSEDGGITGKTLAERNVIPGIGGFRLVGVSGGVVYDNVKVYSDNSYNAANDFNTWSSDRRFYHSGWLETDNEIAPIRTTTSYTYTKADGSTATETANKYGSYVSYGDRANTDITANKFDTVIGAEERATGNKSLKILGQSNQLNNGYYINTHGMNYYFNVPIKAGRAFDIDMDMYLPKENNTFGMGLFTDKNEFGDTSSLSSQGTFATSATNALNNKVLFNLHQGSGTTTNDGTIYFGKGTQQPWSNSQGTEVKSGDDSIKLNVFSDTEGAENNGWTKVKFSYIPKSDDVYFKLTVGEGENAKESQEYKSAMSAANDVLGIQFNHGISAAVGGASFNIDNIKVTEKGTAANNSVVGVYALNYDGTIESINDGKISSGAKAIEIDITKPIESLDGVRVLLNQKDSTGKYIKANAEISEDKSSILVPVTEEMLTLAQNGNVKVNIGLASTIKSADSYLGFFEPQTLSYEIESGEGGFEMNEFRLYRYIDATTYKVKDSNAEVGYVEKTVDGGWHPVTESLKNLPKGTRLKLVADGSNKGAAAEVTILWATEDNNRLVTGNAYKTVTPEKGSFSFESEEFTLDSAPQALKAFIWQNMSPLGAMFKLEKQAEAQETE